jgi:signal transduction histidine kinase/DNA-binding CsgD family transcriptional regulator
VALSELQWSASVVLAAGAGLAMLTLAAGPYSHAPGNGVVLALLVCGPILALRRWALPVLAVTAAATAVVMAEGNAPLPFGLMLGLAVYLVASRLPRRWSVPAAAVTAAALGAALVYVVLAVPHAAPAGEAVVGLVPVAAAWFIGDSVAARRRYLAGLADQAERERAAEAERARQDIREERVRIARELHDVVAHTLAVITVQAGVGRRLAAKRPEEASAALESIETIGRTAQDELRVVLGLLREEETATAPLAPAPRLADVATLGAAVRASGTPVELHMTGADRQLSPALELSVYRVIQEALLTAIRTVAVGEALLAPSVTRRLIAHFAHRAPAPPKAAAGLAELTEREREVLALVARGLSNAELAETLRVSLPTAKTHVSRILTKLGARDRTQLVILAYQSGIVTAA